MQRRPVGGRPTSEGTTMNDAMLKAATSTKVYVGTWVNTTADRMRRRADKGQGAIEYVGIIILVAAIVIALLNTKMGDTIANKFTETVNKVLNGGA
jgi:Flp pilus assembly pilin Flp